MICHACIFYRDYIKQSKTGLPVGISKKCHCLASHNVLVSPISETAGKQVVECDAYSETVEEWDEKQNCGNVRGWTYAEMMRSYE